MKLGKIHNPLPQSLQEDLKKCTHIIQKFTKKELGNDSLAKVIPPDIIKNAKGICIMTVVKAGFLFSGRAGTGLVVARTRDGWSAPSAIGTAGMGYLLEILLRFGGQIGAEVTDFVIILNTEAAVKAFSMGGNVTLGGNLSVAAGPFGRSAEAGGAIGQLAPVFSYSKSKGTCPGLTIGLFAGISIEGSVIVERKDANNIFYGRSIPPQEILSGSVVPPPSCQPLFDALNKQSEVSPSMGTFNGPMDTGKFNYGQSNGHSSLPRYQDQPPTPYTPVKPKFSSDAYQSNDRYQQPQYADQAKDQYQSYDRQSKQNSYDRYPKANDHYKQEHQSTDRYEKHQSNDRYKQQKSNDRYPQTSADTYSTANQSNGRYDEPTTEFGDYRQPAVSKPTPPQRLPIATAIFKFSGERDSDLSLEVGDLVTVLKREDEWWHGRVGRREGDFPANYVRLEE